MILQELIDELEEKDIPNYFKELGIKGNRQSCMYCPVSNYLLTRGFTVSVCSSRIIASDCKIIPGPNLRQFILDFDCGGYPSLVL